MMSSMRQYSGQPLNKVVQVMLWHDEVAVIARHFECFVVPDFAIYGKNSEIHSGFRVEELS